MHRWAVVAAIALGTSGQASAQTLGYYGPPDSYYVAPPAYYLPPPPFAFAPPWYFAPPPSQYYPRAAYSPSYMGEDPLLEAPPPRPRSCGRYRYWNGEYCADARYERPYVGPKW